MYAFSILPWCLIATGSLQFRAAISAIFIPIGAHTRRSVTTTIDCESRYALRTFLRTLLLSFSPGLRMRLRMHNVGTKEKPDESAPPHLARTVHILAGMSKTQREFEMAVFRGQAAVRALSDIITEYRVRKEAERAQAERELALLDAWLAEHEDQQRRYQLAEWE